MIRRKHRNATAPIAIMVDTTYIIDHRELEPVWGLNYAGSGYDDQLVQFTLSISPADMPGEVNFFSDTDKVRLWQTNTKGKLDANGQSNLLSNPETFAASAPTPPSNVKYLPQAFYVEGIHIGSADFKAKYEPPSDVVVVQDEDEIALLPTYVVSLVETQDGRKVIYECSPPAQIIFDPDGAPVPMISAGSRPIVFTVMGGEVFNGNGDDIAGKYTWSVENHNDEDSLGNNHSISVSYGKAGECNVTVDEENADNRRYESKVKATIGSLELERTIRVAQRGYQGGAAAELLPLPDPMPPGLLDLSPMYVDRRTQVHGLVNPLPVGFSDTELPDDGRPYTESDIKRVSTGDGAPTVNSTRLQYAAFAQGELFGGCLINALMGVDRKVYVALVFPEAYDALFKYEDLQAIALHECRHAEQHIAVKNGNSNWRDVDNNSTNASEYVTLREADALSVMFTSNASWKFMSDPHLEGPIPRFVGKDGYGNDAVLDPNAPNNTPPTVPGTGAIDQYNEMTGGPAKSAAKAILQNIYKSIPFDEMKRYQDLGGIPGYKESIRAPK